MKIKIIIFLTIISIISLPVIAKNNQENNNLILGKNIFMGLKFPKIIKKHMNYLMLLEKKESL